MSSPVGAERLAFEIADAMLGDVERHASETFEDRISAMGLGVSASAVEA